MVDKQQAQNMQRYNDSINSASSWFRYSISCTVRITLDQHRCQHTTTEDKMNTYILLFLWKKIHLFVETWTGMTFRKMAPADWRRNPYTHVVQLAAVHWPLSYSTPPSQTAQKETALITRVTGQNECKILIRVRCGHMSHFHPIKILNPSHIKHKKRPALWSSVQRLWSSVQRFWLLIMRYRVQFLALPWGFFPDRGGSPWWPWSGYLVELRFKAPPGTPYSYITINLIVTT
jgi:hypothetical protein